MSGGEKMPDYEKLYFKLFNGITDTINALIKLQNDAEEEYLKSTTAPYLRLVKKDK